MASRALLSSLRHPPTKSGARQTQPVPALLRLQRAIGNRATGGLLTRRTLARDVESDQVVADARGVAQIRDAAKAIGPAHPDTQALIWRLINAFVPESVDNLSSTRYEAGVTGFVVRDVAEGAGDAKGSKLGKGTVVFGDDVIKRAADGKVAELGQELRGAVAQIHAVDLKAGREAIVWIGSERVLVSSLAEKTDAERIIGDLSKKFDVVFDSIAARRAIRTDAESQSGKPPDDEEGRAARALVVKQLKAVEVAPWEYKELQALERGLKRFERILGPARKKSSKASVPQEVLNVGKTTHAFDDTKTPPARGEYFRPDRTFSLYNTVESERGFADTPAKLEGNVVHEIAHGVFAPELGAFMKKTGYWKGKLDRDHPPGAEAPPDDYADTNAGEDLAQSVMYYFVDPKRLKQGSAKPAPPRGTIGNACPRRYEFVDAIVRSW